MRSSKKKAAKEIEKALKQDGDYRIFFVLTLESGRVRPQDKATMELVLQAAPEIGHNYGIIFNKISKRALAKVVENPSGKTPTPAELILASLYAQATPTRFIFWNELDGDLEDSENMVKPLNAKLSQFIRAIPAVHIDSSGVQAIASSDFEAVQQKFEVMLASMHSENAALRAELGRAQEAAAKPHDAASALPQFARICTESTCDVALACVYLLLLLFRVPCKQEQMLLFHQPLSQLLNVVLLYVNSTFVQARMDVFA